jgi:hypothetical protein
MNLQQTITELEQKAAEYTQAANSLRALLAYKNTNGTSGAGSNGSAAGVKSLASTRGAVNKGAGQKASSPKVAGKQQSKRAPKSAETRAKIAAAKARHGKKSQAD